jgi:hypothetical protein
MERTQRSAPPPPGCWALAEGVLGGAHMGGWSIQVFWRPIGTWVFGGMSNGADTEVRPPATRVLGPCGGGARWRAHWGWPIQAFGLPVGARVCGGISNGADTEVRPPATPLLGPCGVCARWRAHWGWSIQDCVRPIGTGVFGCKSNGADTEVRPPAARLWNRLVSLFVKEGRMGSGVRECADC